MSIHPRTVFGLATLLGLAAGTAFLALMFTIGKADAQGVVCGPWSVIRASFAKQFGEVPIGGGVINERGVVVVLSSPEGGTFTIMIVNADGTACGIAAGRDWEPGKLPAKETNG